MLSRLVNLLRNEVETRVFSLRLCCLEWPVLSSVTLGEGQMSYSPPEGPGIVKAAMESGGFFFLFKKVVLISVFIRMWCSI